MSADAVALLARCPPARQEFSISHLDHTAMASDPEDVRGAYVDSAEVPGGGVLQLFRRGSDFEILFEDEQLMGSWNSRSEEAMAALVCARMAPDATRLLIGGLGMGFTLGATLRAARAEMQVVVAELVPGVVGWARGPLASIFGGSLGDPRVSIEVRDVHDVIAEQPGGFDAIMLDVDNGPDGLVSLANERLYCDWGLRSAHAALRRGGILAIWSAYPDGAFAERLEDAGFRVEEVRVEADEPEEAVHTIWLASRLEEFEATRRVATMAGTRDAR